MQALIHSLIYSFINSLIHSLIDSLIHSFISSFICWFMLPFPRSSHLAEGAIFCHDDEKILAEIGDFSLGQDGLDQIRLFLALNAENEANVS